MWYIILIGIIVIAILSGIAGCRNITRINLTNNQNDTTYMYTGDTLTKSEIEKKLKELAKTKPPKELSLGAMCYKVAAPPDRAEYVCPVCGERTLYSDNYVNDVNIEIPICRGSVMNLSSIGASLDESTYCKKCSPDADHPTLILTIKLKDSEPIVKKGISAKDLDLLTEFISGSLVHSDDYDRETPLMDYMERLEYLLDTKVSD